MMRTKRTKVLAAALALLAALLASATAQLAIPGDGSDGAFNPPAGTEYVVDLALAVDGHWNDNNAANAGNGIYDRDQWAVVFKYSSVNIPAGTTVRFTNHPSRAPVVWLVQGDVTIIGHGNAADAEPALSLKGSAAVSGDGRDLPTEPGPGGFRGGATSLLGNGAGLGIGGTTSGASSYANNYGNPQIVPLIGGSGGAGGNGWSGAAGGGAILIACRGTASITGRIDANGGVYGFFAGSAGAIRIVADEIVGDGRLEANSYVFGRIRIETNSLSPDLTTLPETIAVQPAPTPIIFPPANAPKVRILSVAGVDAPDEPLANLTTGTDIGIQSNDAPDVIIETTNFPIEGVVRVRTTTKSGGSAWWTATYVSGNNARALWIATVASSRGFYAIQARATAP